MASFIFILLLCSFHYGYGASYEKNIQNNNVSNISEIKQNDEMSPNNDKIKSFQEQNQKDNQYRNARISNDLQMVQRSSNIQNIYLPHTINHFTDAANTNTADPSIAPEILDLQVPTSANTNRVLLHLPSQQLPLHRTFVTPPRRHYRITLIRNKKPTPAPQMLEPEIEEKTLIYVLVKKPDENPPQIEEMQQNNIKQSAPEVYFIKYKDNNSHNITSTNEKTL